MVGVAGSEDVDRCVVRDGTVGGSKSMLLLLGSLRLLDVTAGVETLLLALLLVDESTPMEGEGALTEDDSASNG